MSSRVARTTRSGTNGTMDRGPAERPVAAGQTWITVYSGLFPDSNEEQTVNVTLPQQLE
jgi:hypothetical protein